MRAAPHSGRRTLCIESRVRPFFLRAGHVALIGHLLHEDPCQALSAPHWSSQALPTAVFSQRLTYSDFYPPLATALVLTISSRLATHSSYRSRRHVPAVLHSLHGAYHSPQTESQLLYLLRPPLLARRVFRPIIITRSHHASLSGHSTLRPVFGASTGFTADQASSANVESLFLRRNLSVIAVFARRAEAWRSICSLI